MKKSKISSGWVIAGFWLGVIALFIVLKLLFF